MILTINEYLKDADCPELCNNDSFTLISPSAELVCHQDAMDAETYSYFLAYGD